MRRITLVTTTINVPKLLDAYAHNLLHFGHKNVEMIVVGDEKTPPAAETFCRALGARVPCTYLSPAAQRQLMAPFSELAEHLPFNCIQRRNVGILLAYAQGADVIITIDDDNFVMGEDFVGLHALVGVERELPTVSSTSGWYNVCQNLACDDGVDIYHRGYPWPLRWRDKDAFESTGTRRARCVVNAGFWLDDPDIDALARMHRQPVVRGLRPGVPQQIALSPGTYSPFNSQNTALAREIIPAYFLSPYLGRYDDIWASYIVLRIAEHLGHAVAFGRPWVRQERNPHDLWRDLGHERLGMELTPTFCQALRACTLTGDNYHDALGALVGELRTRWAVGAEAPEAHHAAKDKLLTGLTLWHEAVGRLVRHEVTLKYAL